MLRKSLALAVMLALAGLIGCGGSNTVEGIVTLDGNPVSGAAVTFIPKEGKGQGGAGLTDTNGKFTITSGKQKGLSPGTYKVTVVKTKSTIEGMDPDKLTGGGKGPMGPEYFKMMEKTKGTGSGGPPMGGPGGGPPMPGPPGGTSTVKSELPAKYATEQTTPFEVKVPLETRPLRLELTSK